MIKKDTKSWTFTCIYEKCKNAYVKRVGFLFKFKMFNKQPPPLMYDK